MSLYYDKMAYERRYSSVYKEGVELWEDPSPTQALVNFVKSGVLKEGVRAIDLGCGEGRDSVFLAKQGFRVVGVDISPSAVRRARKRSLDEHVNVDFVVGDVTGLGFILDEKFDFAIDIGCLHLIVDEVCRHSYLENVYRILKKGGVFFLYNLGGDVEVKLEDIVKREPKPGSLISRRVRTSKGEEKTVRLPVIPAWPKSGRQYEEELREAGFKVVKMVSMTDKRFGRCWMIVSEKP